jgi:hypothetical protein
MPSRAIPRDHWREELDAFSREHEGWRADVRVSSATGDLRTEARDLPLVGVSCDGPGSDRIAVLSGGRNDDHVTHEVAHAVSVDIDQGADAERVNIRAADGSETQILFKRH